MDLTTAARSFELTTIKAAVTTQTKDSVASVPLNTGNKVALVIYIAVGILGITFNSFVVKVFVFLKDKSGIKLFIVALSITDCTSCIVLVFRNSFQVTNNISSFAYYVVTWFMLIALAYDQYLLAMIALDRYLAIVYPMTLKMSFKTQVIVAIIGLPLCMAFLSIQFYSPSNFYFVFLGIICVSFCATSVFYVLIIRRLMRHSASQRRPAVTLAAKQGRMAPTETSSRLSTRTNVNVSNGEKTISSESHTTHNTTAEKTKDARSTNESPSQLTTSVEPAQAATVAAAHPTASASQLQNSIHMQTIRMSSVITAAYLASFIPWILANWSIIPYDRQFLQTFYINFVTSPVLYAFLNRHFKRAAFGRCFSQ